MNHLEGLLLTCKMYINFKSTGTYEDIIIARQNACSFTLVSYLYVGTNEPPPPSDGVWVVFGLPKWQLTLPEGPSDF